MPSVFGNGRDWNTSLKTVLRHLGFGELQVRWPRALYTVYFRDWLTYIFNVYDNSVFRYVVCALWLIWHGPNRLIHDSVIVRIQDIVSKVRSNLLEFDA